MVESGTAGDFDYDDLVTLIHSLPPRYRRSAKLYASTEAMDLMRKLEVSLIELRALSGDVEHITNADYRQGIYWQLGGLYAPKN